MANPANEKKVMGILQGPLELDAKSASDILRIVTWAEMSGIRLACSAFLKQYNKGTIPTGKNAEALLEHESFVQQGTYFGRLLKPIYDVIYEHKHYSEMKLAREEEAAEAVYKSLALPTTS